MQVRVFSPPCKRAFLQSKAAGAPTLAAFLVSELASDVSEIIAVLYLFAGIVRMLLFDQLTTWRSRIVAVAIVVCAVATATMFVNFCALAIRDGWF